MAISAANHEGEIGAERESTDHKQGSCYTPHSFFPKGLRKNTKLDEAEGPNIRNCLQWLKHVKHSEDNYSITRRAREDPPDW